MGDVESKEPSPLTVRVRAIVERIQKLKPVRVWMHYAARRGPILAAGLAYQAIFSVFAALWAVFSAAGIVIGANPELRDALFELLNSSIPGLIDRGDGGAVDPDDLFSATVLGWIGVLGLGVSLFTALAWLSSARDAVRDIAQLAAPPTNFLLLRAKDLGLAIVFGLALIVSAALSVGSTSLLAWILETLGVDERSVGATVAARILGLALAFALDVGVLAGLYRVLAGVPIPPRPLWQGALIGAAALGVLKTLGSALLGGASSNPLVGSFAVIIGLLIWFNFVCQVILAGAAWVVVSARDDGVPLDPEGDRDRRQAEMRLRLEIEEEVRAEYEASLPRAVRWLARRRRRT